MTMKSRLDDAIAHIDHAMKQIEHEKLGEFERRDLKNNLLDAKFIFRKCRDRIPSSSPIVSFDMFNSVDIEKPILGTQSLSCRDIGLCYKKAADESTSLWDKKVYGLLEKLTGYLTLGYSYGRGNPFGTSCGMNGKSERFFYDLKKGQSRVLNKVLPTVRNPSLKARLADIAYYSDKKNIEAAEIAIFSYCKVVKLVFDKKAYLSKNDWNNGYEVCKLIRRAFAICREVGWSKVGGADQLKSLTRDVYKNAYKTRNLYDYNRLARVVLEYSTINPRTVLEHSMWIKNDIGDSLYWEYRDLCDDARKKCEEEECKKKGLKDADKNAGCSHSSEEHSLDLGH